jgi:hypothetical protein
MMRPPSPERRHTPRLDPLCLPGPAAVLEREKTGAHGAPIGGQKRDNSNRAATARRLSSSLRTQWAGQAHGRPEPSEGDIVNRKLREFIESIRRLLGELGGRAATA